MGNGYDAYEDVEAAAKVAMARGDEAGVAAALGEAERLVAEGHGSQTIHRSNVLAERLRRWQGKQQKPNGRVATNRGDIVERFENLEKLKSAGLIKPEEYEETRARLMKEI